MADVWKRDPIGMVDGIPIFTTSDRYIENYQKIAEDHLRAMKSGTANPWIPEDLWKEIEASTRDLIEKHARSGQRILDAGVGMGRLLSDFRDLERHGVDISLDYLRIAREAGIQGAFARLEDLPYKSSAFDIVVCCDVLEHVFDLHICCAELLRVLRPGGTLIVRVPFEERLEAYLADTLPYEFVHVRSFSLPELQLLFSKVFGCQFLESVPAGHHLQGPTRLRFRALPRSEVASLSDALSRTGAGHYQNAFNKITQMAEEDLVELLNDVRGHDLDFYRQITEVLVLPTDINVAFRKSYGY